MPEPSPENSGLAARPARYVFVYGTLRRGGANDITRLQPAPRFMGRASVRGVMYHLGDYPGVLLGGSCRVWGEIYAISPELERQLDAIEQVWPLPTGEYDKREMAVALEEGATDGTRPLPSEGEGRKLRCIVYEINPNRVAGHPSIDSGDWIKSTASPTPAPAARQ